MFDASSDLAKLRGRDARLAESLERELDDLRDEVIYLKVKLRKESQVPRAEYADVRDRIDRLRSEARGEPARAASARPPVNDSRMSATEIPVGTEFDVRLQSRLNSGTARVEDPFDATTIVNYERNGRVLVPAGSVMRGVVKSGSRCQPPGRAHPPVRTLHDRWPDLLGTRDGHAGAAG